jgi:hypothetical protein
MKKLLPSLLAVAAAGCLDSNHEYSLNPDGSGKVAVKLVFTPFNLDLGAEKTPDEKLKDAARAELEKAEGVDAWKDVAFRLRPDGKSEFQGTAYFKDLSKLKLHNQGFSGLLDNATITKDPAGATTLELKPRPKDGDAEASEALTDEQVKAKLAEERARWQQMKPVLTGVLGELKARERFRLPAPVTASSNFKREGDDAISVAIDGAALLKALDALVADDARFSALLRSGAGLQKAPPPGDEFFGLVLGEKGPLQATFAAGGKPLFDYAAELAAAKAAEPALRKSLGLGAAVQVEPPAAGAGLKDVRVVGVRHVHVADPKRGIRPLNSMETGLTLSVLAEFPGPVLGVKEGKLLKATSDAGENLLPKRDWDRRLGFPQLTEDRTAVVFDLTLKAPAATAKGLGEVSGTLIYQVGGKTKDVDVGLAAWTAGSKGKELGAEIEDFNEQPFDKSQVMGLKLQMARETVAGVEFYDEAGQKLDAKPSGFMSMGRSTTLHYALKGKFPAKGRIVVKVYDDLRSTEVPFVLKDLDLLGRPAGK